MHRLVQTVVKDEMSEDELTQISSAAVDLTAHAVSRHFTMYAPREIDGGSIIQ